MAASPPIHLELAQETSDKVQELAAAQQRHPQDLLREAVDQYLARTDLRNQLLQDASAALDEYRRTGLHANDEEADLWLSKLERGEDAEIPECHV